MPTTAGFDHRHGTQRSSIPGHWEKHMSHGQHFFLKAMIYELDGVLAKRGLRFPVDK